jgi:hypothetical protein
MTSSTEQHAVEPRQQRRLPDFFVVGHHKSGTTALYEMLRRHPQIYLPDHKEPRFFAGDLRPLLQAAPGSLPETLEDYLSLYDAATPEQRTGDASPSYLRSHTAAQAIAEAQPGARIIAILREPASFVRSLHLHLLQEGVEQESDLRSAVANEAIERQGRSINRYSDHVRYVEQLRRYHDVFPPEQVLVLIYDDFRADNQGTIRRVLRFLEVDETYPTVALEANSTVRVRSAAVDKLVRSLKRGSGPVAGSLKVAIKRLTSKRLRSKLLAPGILYGAPPPPDEELMLELRRRFEPEVVALSEYLGRDLVSAWGYDDLG